MMAAAKKTKDCAACAGTRGKKLRLLPLSKPVTPNDIIDRARQYGPACVDALAEVAAGGTDAARVSAAVNLLDRGFGKVGQPVEVSGPEGGPVGLEVGLSPAVAAALEAIKAAGEAVE